MRKNLINRFIDIIYKIRYKSKSVFMLWLVDDGIQNIIILLVMLRKNGIFYVYFVILIVEIDEKFSEFFNV